jgi:hypothetical protein
MKTCKKRERAFGYEESMGQQIFEKLRKFQGNAKSL